VQGQLFGDVPLQGVDLAQDRANGGDQCLGDMREGGAVFAGGAAGGGGQRGVDLFAGFVGRCSGRRAAWRPCALV